MLKSDPKEEISFIYSLLLFFSKTGIRCQALYWTLRNQTLGKTDVAFATVSLGLKCGEKGEEEPRQDSFVATLFSPPSELI